MLMAMGAVGVLVRVSVLVFVFMLFVVMSMFMVAAAIVAMLVGGVIVGAMCLGGVIVAFVIVMIMSVMIVRVIFVRMFGVNDRLIGASVGLERRFNMADLGAKSAHHILKHMVAAHPQPVVHYLRLHVAIADMISDARQLARIVAPHFCQLFRSGHDLDQAPVFQDQRVAAVQHHGLWEIEQEFCPARARHRHTATMTALIIQNDGVGRGRLPGAFAANEIRADHAFPPGMASGCFVFCAFNT